MKILLILLMFVSNLIGKEVVVKINNLSTIINVEEEATVSQIYSHACFNLKIKPINRVHTYSIFHTKVMKDHNEKMKPEILKVQKLVVNHKSWQFYIINKHSLIEFYTDEQVKKIKVNGDFIYDHGIKLNLHPPKKHEQNK